MKFWWQTTQAIFWHQRHQFPIGPYVSLWEQRLHSIKANKGLWHMNFQKDTFSSFYGEIMPCSSEFLKAFLATQRMQLDCLFLQMQQLHVVLRYVLSYLSCLHMIQYVLAGDFVERCSKISICPKCKNSIWKHYNSVWKLKKSPIHCKVYTIHEI